MKTEDDDLYVRNLVDPEKIGNAAERAWIRETILAEPRIAGNLLARDGGDSAANFAEISGYARRIAAEVEERFPGIIFRPVGTIDINHSFNKA